MIQFQDIMTKEIVFYDKDYRSECKEFCNIRDIHFLPDLHNSKLGFKNVPGKKGFEQFRIQEDQFVCPEDNIFTQGIQSKFNKHEILFVRSGNELLGIVHFSDYSRPPVYKEIYQKLYKLERGLIYLLIEYSGRTIQELLDFLKEQASKKGSTFRHTCNPNNPQERLNQKVFSYCRATLKDIMEFSSTIDLLQIKDIDNINLLRNKIAHSEDLVRKHSYVNGSLTYDFQTFKKLIAGKKALEIAIKQVANRAYLMKAVNIETFTLRASNVYEEAFS